MERAITTKQRLWMGVALLHLCLVTFGASGVPLPTNGSLGEALDQYSRATGSGFGYGFFAPGIYNQLMARFKIIDNKGRTREVPLARGLNKESDLRMGSVIDKFGISQEEKDPKAARAFQRSFSASLARIFFVRYPEAERVIVELHDYEPLSRADYLKNEKPKVTVIYRAEYSYHPQHASNEKL